MEPQIGQVWKFSNNSRYTPIIEYHLIVGYIPKVTRWILYNIQTGEPDMDYTDQFRDQSLWTFIQ